MNQHPSRWRNGPAPTLRKRTRVPQSLARRLSLNMSYGQPSDPHEPSVTIPVPGIRSTSLRAISPKVRYQWAISRGTRVNAIRPSRANAAPTLLRERVRPASAPPPDGRAACASSSEDFTFRSDQDHSGSRDIEG